MSISDFTRFQNVIAMPSASSYWSRFPAVQKPPPHPFYPATVSILTIPSAVSDYPTFNQMKPPNQSKVWTPEQALNSKGSSLRSHFWPRSRAARNSLIKFKANDPWQCEDRLCRWSDIFPKNLWRNSCDVQTIGQKRIGMHTLWKSTGLYLNFMNGSIAQWMITVTARNTSVKNIW